MREELSLIYKVKANAKTVSTAIKHELDEPWEWTISRPINKMTRRIKTRNQLTHHCKLRQSVRLRYSSPSAVQTKRLLGEQRPR